MTGRHAVLALIVAALLVAGCSNEDDIPCSLDGGGVTPAAGFRDSSFTFSVHYYDPDREFPLLIQVHIGASAFDMELNSGSAWDGNYIYEAVLDSGVYEYYFVAADACCEVRDPCKGAYPGPTVVQEATIAWVHDGLGEDEDWTNAETGISANWAETPGADAIEYSVSTDSEGAPSLWWTQVPAGQTQMTLAGITLEHGATYYFSLRTVVEGLCGEPVTSDGITADHAPPVSAVLPVGQVYVDEPVRIEWAGEDDGSGIAHYDVEYGVRYLSGVEWMEWLAQTPETSAYHDPLGSCTYLYFRCRAADRAGNTEEWPTEPHAYDTWARTDCPKVALHVQAHNSKMNCTTYLPEIENCRDLETTYSGFDFDVFVVFFDISSFTSLEYGLTWPGWTYSCAWTPCGGDDIEGSIVWPGDGVTQTWSECQTGNWVIAGWGWMYADGPGRICPTEHPVTGRIGLTDCHAHFIEAYPAPPHRVCAGVHGEVGDDPCGPISEPGASWEGVKKALK